MLIETFLSLIHRYITPKISHIDILTRQNKLLYASSEKLPPKKNRRWRRCSTAAGGSWWMEETDRQTQSFRGRETEVERGRETCYATRQSPNILVWNYLSCELKDLSLSGVWTGLRHGEFNGHTAYTVLTHKRVSFISSFLWTVKQLYLVFTASWLGSSSEIWALQRARQRQQESAKSGRERCADDATGGWTGIGCVVTDCMKASTADVEKIWGEDLEKAGAKRLGHFRFSNSADCMPACHFRNSLN